MFGFQFRCLISTNPAINNRFYYSLYFTLYVAFYCSHSCLSLNKSNLLAGGILCGKTVTFDKESRDRVWRSGIVCSKLAFTVHCVSMVTVHCVAMVSEATNSASPEELLTR